MAAVQYLHFITYCTDIHVSHVFSLILTGDGLPITAAVAKVNERGIYYLLNYYSVQYRYH